MLAPRPRPLGDTEEKVFRTIRRSVSGGDALPSALGTASGIDYM